MPRVVDDEEMTPMRTIMFFDKICNSAVNLMLGSSSIVELFDARLVVEAAAE